MLSPWVVTRVITGETEQVYWHFVTRTLQQCFTCVSRRGFERRCQVVIYKRVGPEPAGDSVFMESVPLKCGLVLVSLSIWVLAATQLTAQEPVSTAESESTGRMLDNRLLPDLLHCSIQPRKPMLDFAFRFDIGFIVRCSLARFAGRTSKVLIYARVTPEGGKPVLLGETYRVPGAGSAAKPSQLKQDVEMSGGFAVGEGRYQVEVLVLDQETGRTSRKRWRASVAHSGRPGPAHVAVPPGAVLPIGVWSWRIKMDTSGKGLRLTVLLDAAPLNPRTPALRAWDRAFLLGSLSSLLKQIPCASVRMRAFNLEQQRELFRQDQFDDAGFMELAEALRTLELGTVSYRVLQQRQGGLNLLADYANSELRAADPADAIIILGPATRYFAKVSFTKSKRRESPNPHFYYFEYFPGHWPGSPQPDALASLTTRLEGSVCPIFSPDDLARCVQKVLTRVQPTTEPFPAPRWTARPAPTH